MRKGINRASQSYTEVGSSIKPLAVYGPALDLGYSPGSITYNMDGPINGWTTEKEIIASDRPWAVAWYADRKSLWLPMTVKDFLELNDYGNDFLQVVDDLLLP